MGYRLRSVEIAGFRGFNDQQTLLLNQELVILYAQNGFGKSSFCEAIEWGLYGETARQSRGEKNVDKREFSHSLRNKFYPTTKDAYVSLDLYDSTTGENLCIKRVISDVDVAGHIFLDGVAADDLSILNLPNDIKFSLILQHSIRDFIFSKPGDRLNLISAQLGMGQISALQDHLQNASKSFKTKPSDVDAAAKCLDSVKAKCKELGGFDEVLKLVASAQPTEIDLIRIVSNLFYGTSTPTLIPDRGTFKRDIDREITLTMSTLFDCSRIAPVANLDQKEQVLLKKTQTMVAEFESKREIILASADKKTKQEILTLTKLGLSLIADKKVCPLCGQPITETHIQEMKAVIESKIEEFDLEDFLRRIADEIESVKSGFASLVPQLLTEIEEKKLKDLLNDQPTLFDPEYSSKLDQVKQISTDVSGIFQRTSTSQAALLKASGLEEVKESFTTFLTDLKSLVPKLSQVTLTAKELLGIYSRIDVCIQGKLTSSVAVQRLSLLKLCLDNAQNLCLAVRDNQVESQVEDALKFVQDFAQNKRSEILKAKSKEMTEWFTLLHPSSSVTFKGMRTTTKQISLLGDVFGEEVNVSSTFSEAQLNCLGLSFYAVTAFAPNNPFDFVIIDDPVQSMDQSHIDNFQDSYLRKFLDAGKQVLLLTHMQTLALSADILFNHLSPITLEIESYDKSGPKIVESKNVLDRLLEDIRFFMKGDSEYRRTAGGKLRRLLERMIKELYVKKNGTLPKKFESASWAELKSMVPSCGLDIAETGRLFESYKFCVSFPHDDRTKEPPVRAQIESHYDRLKRIKDKHLGT